MELKDYVAVGGLPGLYKLVSTRSNGLLIQEMDTDKTRFVSSRKHQFTPLETVAIYTKDDSIKLSVIFERIKENKSKLSLPNTKAGNEEYFNYFSEILPDYDQERVLISDVKKVVKWYKFLNDRDLLHKKKEEKVTEDEAISPSVSDKKKDKE